MTKRIIAILTAFVLLLSCSIALAEAVQAGVNAEAEAQTEATPAEDATEVEPAAEEAVAEEEEEVAEEEAEEETLPEGEIRYISAYNGLYIRQAPELDAEIVATPDYNYEVLEISKEGKWSFVIFETNGVVYEGYAWTAYLSPKKLAPKTASEAE